MHRTMPERPACFDFTRRLPYLAAPKSVFALTGVSTCAFPEFSATIAAAAIALGFALSPASARIGVVMLHGNGSWGGQFEPMVPIFKAAGFGFEAPDMCWADIRQYDRSAMDCMDEVDKAIAKLKADGYDQIVVGGHSLGGINALLYAANHKGLVGVIAFAPSLEPGRSNQDPTVQWARGLVAQGLGDKRIDFPTTGINSIYSYPSAWLTYFAPESLLYANDLVPQISAPLLWVVGSDDPGQADAPHYYAKAPSTPLNQFITVKADHFATPDVATPQMMDWLNSLQASLDKAKQTN